MKKIFILFSFRLENILLMKTISMNNFNKLYRHIFQKLKINPKSMIIGKIFFLVGTLNIYFF